MSFAVVIPSARAENLVPCVRAIQERDPVAEIVVIDDGARAESESQLERVHWVEGVKPFVFARNVNRGIDYAQGRTVILLNDDALLQTPFGFSALTRAAEQSLEDERVGVMSAAIRGTVGNFHQRPVPRSSKIRITHQRLAFVCVAIPAKTLAKIGYLDERFVGYGGDDRDYCHRVLLAGMKLGIFDGCVVEHSTTLRPTFRSDRASFPRLEAQGRRIYEEKWSGFRYPD